MALSAGDRLGHYEILAPLGEGGMGEVYRARDERLGREVAIKVLLAAVADDEARLARFEREARLLASLSHQNIATLYGLDEHEGQRFLAMELAEGETLAERVKRGPIPVEDALPIALQIAEGLEAAHEEGIIHRDLKPSNVMLSPEGKVKILDFGLAKAWRDEVGDVALTDSPTITAQLTAGGVLLGTASYMSPEQARGRPTDRQADIWAFGCVLWEMLTGRRLFDGDTVTDVLVGVLRKEPDWRLLPPDVAAPLRRLLSRCLEKDPRRRTQDVGDARIVLEDVLTGRLDEDPSSIGIVPRRQRAFSRVVPWVITAILAVGVASLLVVRAQRATVQPLSRSMTLSVELSGDDPLPQDGGAAAAPSPDGRSIAFVAGITGSTHLYLRALDALDARLLPGTEGAVSPIFSPDGRWIAFFANGLLKKVSIGGDEPATICGGCTGPRGGTWSTSGDIVLSPNYTSPLYRVPSAGGDLERLTELDGAAGERSHRWPHSLPGGEWVLFLVQHHGDNYEDGDIDAVNLTTGERRVVLRGGSFPVYSRSGHLLFTRRGTLFAARFDANRLEVTGEPRPVVDNVLSLTGDQEIHDGSAQVAISDTGLLTYRIGQPSDTRVTMVLVDRQGNVTPVLENLADSAGPQFSPDGSRISLLQSAGQGNDLLVFDRADGQVTRLTTGTSVRQSPIWTPDGKRITFSQAREGKSLDMYWMRADGTGGEELLLSDDDVLWPMAWSPDGSTLMFRRSDPDGNIGLWTMRFPREAGGEPAAQKFLQTHGNIVTATFSPDGRWVAFSSDESGEMQIYVVRSDDPGRRWRVSDLPGRVLEWPDGGREIFFLSGSQVFSATVSTTGNLFRVEQTRELFAGNFQFYSDLGGCGVSPDGQQFVMFQRQGGPSDSALTHLVLDFDGFEELNRLLPRE